MRSNGLHSQVHHMVKLPMPSLRCALVVELWHFWEMGGDEFEMIDHDIHLFRVSSFQTILTKIRHSYEYFI